MQEIELLRSLSFDANIVQFYGACLQEENTMMVLEFMAVRLLFYMATSYFLYAHSVCSSVLLCQAQCATVSAALHNMLVATVGGQINFCVENEPSQACNQLQPCIFQNYLPAF